MSLLNLLCAGPKSDELRGGQNINMEVIYQGWLIKSPPEKKIQGHWIGKIFPAKWRRRYFVLHVPPASASLPGSYELAYYDNENLRKKYGSIDLDQCEECITTLDSAHYKHLFALRTKHKGRDRTYYLAADSSQDMNKFVECLCKVCGFRPDPTEEVYPSNPSPGEDAWPTTVAPAPLQTHPSTISAQSDGSLNRSNSSCDSQIRRSSNGEPYIPLGDCFSDTYPQRTSRKSNRRSGESPLNQVPPPPMAGLCKRPPSTDSIPEMPAPPPPLKTGESKYPDTDPNQTYDHPSKSYVNIDTVDTEFDDGIYKVPPRHFADDGIYKEPPRRHYNHSESIVSQSVAITEDEYDYPRPGRPSSIEKSSQRDSNSSGESRVSQKPDSAYGSEDAFYDYPKRSDVTVDQMSNRLRSSTLQTNQEPGDFYQVPPPRKAQSETNILDQMPPPPRPPKPSGPATTVAYMNVPSNSKAHSSVISDNKVAAMEAMYDVPTRKPSDQAMLTMSPPPPQPHAPKLHRYVNAPAGGRHDSTHDSMYLPMDSQQESYLPMQVGSSNVSGTAGNAIYTPMGGGQGVYTDMSNPNVQMHAIYTVPPTSYSATPGSKPPRLQRINADAPEVVGEPDTYAIVSTNRTRSFIRQVNPTRQDIKLPTRKPGIPGASSSEDDDSDTDSEPPPVIDNPPLKTVQACDHVPPLANKKHLNSTPPPPQQANEIQYLDLDLEGDESHDRSPVFARPPAAPGNVSPTDYKEIDFVKTKALSEVRKDVQSKRKSSEKSLDE